MRAGVLVASKYRLLREIGAGGMGSVWHAVHVVTERDFAIKFLHASSASSASLLARFFQEARVSGKLRHPSIIEIFDVGSAPELGGAPFLVMELLDGASLDVLLRKVGPLPPRIVAETVAEVARALALAHDRGIVHRDLKPANIFLHRPGTGAVVPKVLDFGISKIAPSGTPDVGSGGGLTQTGAVLGSPLYMSPEQASSDKTIDGRSDVHALGIVMWECLVGSPPFLAESYNNLIVQIITGERPRLADAAPSLPPAAAELAAVVERAMARRREDRFQSALELADALDGVLADLPAERSLRTRTAAAELFASITHPSIRPEGPPFAAGGSTTGGMEVPSSRGGAHDASPVAVTMTERGSPVRSSAAYQDTEPASLGASPLSRERLTGPAPAPVATEAITAREESTRRRGTRLLVAGLLAALVGGAVVVGLDVRHPTATAAIAAPTEPPTPPVASSAAVLQAPAPSASAAAQGPTASVTRAPASVPIAPRLAAPGATAHGPPKGAPRPTKDSVESSGL